MEIIIQLLEAVVALAILAWAVTGYKRYEIAQYRDALGVANRLNETYKENQNTDFHKLQGYKLWAIKNKVPFPPEEVINAVADELRLKSAEEQAEFIRDSRES